jgi:hypothetical protein
MKAKTNKPAATAEPPKVPEPVQATVAAPPAPPDPFDSLSETYLSAEQVHAAYESGLVCSKCGQPVLNEWPRCPVCGNTKAAKAAAKSTKFKEAVAKYRPAPPADDVVSVKEVPKDGDGKGTAQ